MGSTYKTPGVYGPRQSVFIAAPANECVKPGFAYSLAMTTAELSRQGVPFQLAVMEGNCHVDDGRNSLVEEFLEGNCSDFFFLDTDVMWSADEFLKLLKHEEEFIAGVYPFKAFPRRFPVGKILSYMENGLLEMSYVPTGFMRLRRTVFEKLIPTQSRCGTRYRFFERRYSDSTYDGGDVTFCRKWIAAGGKVLLDPSITLGHIGEYRFTGCFLDHLENDENLGRHTTDCADPVPAYKSDVLQPVKGTPVGDPPKPGSLAMIAAGELLRGSPVLAHFQDLADAWGNKPWAATPEYLEAAWQAASKLHAGDIILECGSGISTLVLWLAARRSGATLTVLEHEVEWRDHVQKWYEALKGLKGDTDLNPMHYADVKYSSAVNWYVYEPTFTPDLLVIDGPPRYLGTDRLYPLRQSWTGRTQVLLDDADAVVLEQLRAVPGYWVPRDFGGRSGVVGQANVGPEDMRAAAE